LTHLPFTVDRAFRLRQKRAALPPAAGKRQTAHTRQTLYR